MPGELHGHRSLAVYSPWGFKESDVNEPLTLSFLSTKTSQWKWAFVMCLCLGHYTWFSMMSIFSRASGLECVCMCVHVCVKVYMCMCGYVCVYVCMCVCARAQNQASGTPGVNRLSSSKCPVYSEAICRGGPSECSCRKGPGSETPESNVHNLTHELGA